MEIALSDLDAGWQSNFQFHILSWARDRGYVACARFDIRFIVYPNIDVFELSGIVPIALKFSDESADEP